MAPFKTIEEEQRYLENEYLKNFSSTDYYMNYCKDGNTYKEFPLISLHAAFSLDVKSGDSVLDVGCGPNIYTAIAASKLYQNIVVSDLLETNREFIRKWLQKDPNAHEFKYAFKIAAALEHEPDATKLEARVRNSVKEVISCNVHESNPIAPDQRTFDVIVSNCCLESASLTLESYRRSMSNMANLLKPGGKLFLSGVLKSTHYKVNGHTFYNPSLTKHNVKKALRDAGLNPCFWQTRPFIEQTDCDCKTLFFVKGIKTGK